jgi:cytoskeletal protein RodZ
MRRSTTKVIRVELVDNNEQEFSYERPAVTNLKLTLLILMTFGIIVGMYALTYSFPHVATPSRLWKAASSTPTWHQEESSSVSSLSTSSSSESDGTAEQDSVKCLREKQSRNKLQGKRLCRHCRIWSD